MCKHSNKINCMDLIYCRLMFLVSNIPFFFLMFSNENRYLKYIVKHFFFVFLVLIALKKSIKLKNVF